LSDWLISFSVGIRFGQKFCPKRTLFFIRFGHWPKATFFFIRFGHWPKRKLFICYYFIRFGQSKIFFMVSAKSCYLCFSDKLINCTFRPKIIKYTFRPKFVSLFTSFFTRGREKAGVYSYWHCSLTDVWQSEIAHILHHRKQSISLIANRVILF
jgi:hypothetical protein